MLDTITPMYLTPGDNGRDTKADRRAERAEEAATARERAMADAIDAVCLAFEPDAGDVTTPRTRAAYAALVRASEELTNG